jgi:hypothetical protein
MTSSRIPLTGRMAGTALSLALSLVVSAVAQDEEPELGWKRTASGNLNLNQAYFDNWTKGGSNALSWETRLEGAAVRKEADWDWESRGKAAFGQSHIDGLGTRKAGDELTLETIYTRKISEWVNPFASARLQTQFAAGYSYDDEAGTSERVSGPFDPTYFIQTVGLGRNWGDEYKLRAGAALKETFSAARYGYAGADGFKIEPGASAVAEVRRGVMENILLASVLDVFIDFRGVDAVDVRWENQVTAKVNSFVSTNFSLDLLYDKDLSTRRQIRQTLGVAVSFLSI